MKKKILVLGIILAVVMAIAVPLAALAATNDAEQYAETTSVTTISIQNQAATTDITSITFPAATAGTTGVIPFNNLDGSGSPQVFHATASVPVVTLVTSTAYIAWINITAGTGWTDTVSAEDYYIITDASTTVDATDFANNKTTFSTWGTAESTGVTLTPTGTNDNYLYLTIDLTSAVGKMGTSTLTILGETP